MIGQTARFFRRPLASAFSEGLGDVLGISGKSCKPGRNATAPLLLELLSHALQRPENDRWR
jgi:hypothetical protein